MAKSFSTLQAKIPAARRRRTQERVRRTVALMTLHELRRELRITQHDVAAKMATSQGEVSKIERRTDIKLSTLGEYIHSLGGKLELRAIFPDREASLDFGELATTSTSHLRNS